MDPKNKNIFALCGSSRASFVLHKKFALSVAVMATFFAFLVSTILLPLLPQTEKLTPKAHAASTSSTLNFQARLLTPSGSLVPDGYYNIRFKLYDGGTQGGPAGQGQANAGTQLWSEEHKDTNGASPGQDYRVRVVNGYFSVYLGSQTAFPSINWDQELWLTMDIGGTTQTATPTYDGEMLSTSPAPNSRIKLSAVPYAFKAGQLAKTTGSYNSTLDFATQTASRSILLPDESGTICIQGSASCGFALSGSGSFIQNGTSLQTTANFNIQSAGASSVGGVIRGATSQTADLFQLQDSAGTVLTAFSSSGQLIFGGDTNLYRSGVDTLKTDDSFAVGSNVSISSGGNITQTGATTLSTGTGSVSLNGNTTVKPSSNNANAFRVRDISDNNVLQVSTANGNKSVQVGQGGIDSAFRVVDTTSSAIFDVDTAFSTVAIMTGASLVNVSSSQIYLGGSDIDFGSSIAFMSGSDFSTTGVSNNVNFSEVSLVRLTGASAQTITGIANGRDGEILTIVNAANQSATISNNSGSSTATNRIITGTGADITLNAGASITLIYDAGASLWRTTGSVAFSTGNFIQNGTSPQTADFNITGNGVIGGTLTVAGLLTANGNLTLQTGDTFTINGDALTDLTGSGLINSSGALTVDATSATGFFRNGGNSFGGAATLGTNDNYALNLETNGATRFVVSNSVSSLTGQGNTTISSNGGYLLLGSSAANGISLGTGNTNPNYVNIGGANGLTPDAQNLSLQATANISLGNGSSPTIQIGNTSGAVTQNINIGNNATASSVTNISMGSSIGTSTTTIRSGTGNISLSPSGSSNTGVVVRPSVSNSTATFQVQNQAGTALLNTDTTNMRVSVGSIGTATGQLYVSGNIPTSTVGSVVTGSESRDVRVQGRYAYTVNYSSNTLTITDISNPASPTNKGSIATGSGPHRLFVEGRYAYVANGITPTLAIYDISNPASPSSMGSIALVGAAQGVFVQGRYAYVTVYATLYIFDISNPASPTSLGSVMAPGGGSLQYPQVQGRYAYSVNFNTSKIEIFDISNPASPTSAGGASVSGNPRGIYVQGKYAYLVSDASHTLQIFDISNPSSPTSVGSVATGTNPYSVYTQGRYAYVVSNSSNTLQIFDISNPASPTSVGNVATDSGPDFVSVQGRYAYVAAFNKLQIFDLGGAYIQQLEVGGTETGTLSVQSAGSIGGNLSVQGGLTVAGASQLSGNVGMGGQLDITGSLATKRGTDYTTTGTSNDVNFGDVSLVRLNGVSAQTITGIAGGRDGEILTIINHAGQNATISNNSGSSIPANRIITGTNADITLNAGASITLIYDAGANLWRVTGGAAFSTTNFIQNGTSPQTADFNITGNGVVGGTLAVNGGSLTTTSATFNLLNTGATTVNAFGAATTISLGASTGTTTINNGLTLAAGKTLTVNGDAITDLTGSGLTVSSGALTVDATSATGFFRNGGNSFGGVATLGTNDNYVLNLETNGATRFQITNNGSKMTGQGLTEIDSTGALFIGGDGSNGVAVGGNSVGPNQIAIGGGPGANYVDIQANTKISLGEGSVANTIQLGSSFAAVAQTINVGNNSTAGSTNNVNIGSSVAGTTAIAGATTITNRTSGSTDTLIISNSTSTGNILQARDNATAVLTIADGGAATFSNQTNGTTAFRIQNASAQNLFVADTTNQRVAIGPASVPANSVLTIGTDTTTASGGITFGTDTAFYRYAQDVLATDGSFFANGGNFFATTAYTGLTFSTATNSGIYNTGANGAGYIAIDNGTAGVPVIAIAQGGATTFKNNTDSVAAFQIQSSSSTVLLNADTTNMRITIGGATGSLAGRALEVTSVDITTTLRVGDGTNGISFNDQTSGKLRFRGTAQNDISVTLSPEYAGAVLTGDGSNNTGTMTSDFCSGSSLLNIGTSCGASEDHNFYAWTANATNDYDIYVKWKVPSDFASFASTPVQFYGWKTGGSDAVQMRVYKSGSSTVCDNDSLGSNGSWALTNSNPTTSCSISAGDELVFRMTVSVATNGNYARVGEIFINYKSQF